MGGPPSSQATTSTVRSTGKEHGFKKVEVPSTGLSPEGGGTIEDVIILSCIKGKNNKTGHTVHKLKRASTNSPLKLRDPLPILL